jgi:hypothetical protein
MTPTRKLSVPFLCGIAGLTLLLLALNLLAASGESFSRDDFAFLAYVQRPHWSWLEVYLPLDERWWWAYRPLGMQTFFYFAYQLFGLDSFGYFCTAILLHIATAALAYRLMLRLGFGPPVAAVTALISISRYPATRDVLYGSVFHYTAATCFVLLTLITFIDYVRAGRVWLQVASCACLVLALLCNEFPVVIAVLLFFVSLYAQKERPFRLDSSNLRRALVHSLPQLAIAALYLVYRFRVIAEVPAHRAYVQTYGVSHITGNVGKQLFYYFGDAPTLIGAGVVLAGVLWSIARSEEGRALARSWMFPVQALCVVWAIGVLAPFAILVVTHSRFSIPLELPVSIFLGALLEVAWRIHSGKRRRHLEAGLLVLVLVSLPYATLWERHRSPVGVYGEMLAEAVRTHAPPIAEGSRIVLLYNAPGLASHAGGAKFKRYTFGGTAALQAYFNDQALTLQLHDLWQSPVGKPCRDCVYMQLMPKLEVRPAEERFIHFRPPYPRSTGSAPGMQE